MKNLVDYLGHTALGASIPFGGLPSCLRRTAEIRDDNLEMLVNENKLPRKDVYKLISMVAGSIITIAFYDQSIEAITNSTNFDFAEIFYGNLGATFINAIFESRRYYINKKRN